MPINNHSSCDEIQTRFGLAAAAYAANARREREQAHARHEEIYREEIGQFTEEVGNLAT